MALSHSVTVAFLVTALACQLALVNTDRKPDCRRVVFHPYCRGISAKRSSHLKLLRPDYDEQTQDNMAEDGNRMHPRPWPHSKAPFPHGKPPRVIYLCRNTRRSDPYYYYDYQPIASDQQRASNFGNYYQTMVNQGNGASALHYPPKYILQNVPCFDAFSRQIRVLKHPDPVHPRRVPRQRPVVAPYDLDYFPYYKRL